MLRTIATPPVSTVWAGPSATGARAGPSDSSDKSPVCCPASKSQQATTVMTQNGTTAASEFALSLVVTFCLRMFQPPAKAGGGRRQGQARWCTGDTRPSLDNFTR